MRVLIVGFICGLIALGCNSNTEVIIDTDTEIYEASVFACIDGIGIYMGNDSQGLASYGNVAFCFYDSGFCQSIDLKEKKIIASFKLPGNVCNPRNHCGVACFSDEFLMPDDKYPLLFLSSYKELKCYVLRITETGADCIRELQLKDDDGNVIPAFAFMPDGNKVVIKANYPVKEDGVFLYKWIVLERTSERWSDVKDLHTNDIIDSFYSSSSDAYNAGFCKNGRIYQLAGYGGYGEQKLYVIDYMSRSIISEIVWTQPFLYEHEQEQCSPYGDDSMIINYNGVDYLSFVKLNNWKY